MARLARFLFGLGLGLLAQGAPAFAQSGALPDAAPKVQASFIAEHGAVAPGGKVTVALRELIRENWHTYWVNPGDSGAPTIINWQLPEGWTAAESSRAETAKRSGEMTLSMVMGSRRVSRLGRRRREAGERFPSPSTPSPAVVGCRAGPGTRAVRTSYR